MFQHVTIIFASEYQNNFYAHISETKSAFGWTSAYTSLVAVSAKSSTLVPCILMDEETNIDINQEMLNAGFGERRFTINQKPPRSPQQQQQQQQPQQQHQPTAPVIAPSPARPGMTGGGMGPVPAQRPKPDFGDTWQDDTAKTNDTHFR